MPFPSFPGTLGHRPAHHVDPPVALRRGPDDDLRSGAEGTQSTNGPTIPKCIPAANPTKICGAVENLDRSICLGVKGCWCVLCLYLCVGVCLK